MHNPVMLSEVIEYLNIGVGANIIDATLNGGGHTKAILEKFQNSRVLGIEYDPKIFQEFQLEIQNFNFGDRLITVNDNYVNLKSIIDRYSLRPDGILFDLGVSSFHYEKSGRGFSFQKNEFLDMRFNPAVDSKTASDIINTESKNELEKILRSYGEEIFAEQIAENIVKTRSQKPIITTDELVKVINSSVPNWYKRRKINPATKTFQALRVAVNDELGNVEKGILAAIDVLNSKGRLVVISFQGSEDKIVREIFKSKAKEKIVKWIIKGTIKPKWDEVRVNPRARSAKMKVVEKL